MIPSSNITLLTSLTCGLNSSSSSGFVASEGSWQSQNMKFTKKGNWTSTSVPSVRIFIHSGHPEKPAAALSHSKLNQRPDRSRKQHRVRHQLFSPHLKPKPSYHLPDVGEESVSKILSGFNGELRGKVVNGAHEDPVSLDTAGTRDKMLFDCNTKCNTNNSFFWQQLFLWILCKKKKIRGW